MESYGQKVIAEQKSRREGLEKEWKAQWSTPITFYGKVLDEGQNPVAGAAVEFQWTDAQGEGINSSASTDESGNFSLTGVPSKALSVRIAKEGYYSSNKVAGTMFVYADLTGRPIFQPNPRSPVLFYLRKSKDSEPLVHGKKPFRLPTERANAICRSSAGKEHAFTFRGPRD